LILGLDIASVTGWAVGLPGSKPLSGYIKLAGDIGPKMHQLHDALHGLVRQHDPTWIVFEQPIHEIPKRRDKFGNSVGKGSPATLRMSLALCGVAEMVASEANIPVAEVFMGTWRKHFIGAAQSPKGQTSMWLKNLAVQRCKQLGWGELTHDAAEACGVWDYACSLRSKAHQVQTAPGLFERKAR